MYLHEDHYYLIRNSAVARNSIFCDFGIQKHFKEKMKYYLDPLCEILAYNLKDHEFQLLVKLKSREEFVKYFREKTGDKQEYLEIPRSTYIFSQAMSNLQVSLVKKFNHKYGRKGTLLSGRFYRELVKTKEGVIKLIQSLNRSEEMVKRSGIWAESAMNRMEGMTRLDYYEMKKEEFCGDAFGFWRNIKKDLVGKFYIPQINVDIYPIRFHQSRLFKSLCNYSE